MGRRSTWPQTVRGRRWCSPAGGREWRHLHPAGPRRSSCRASPVPRRQVISGHRHRKCRLVLSRSRRNRRPLRAASPPAHRGSGCRGHPERRLAPPLRRGEGVRGRCCWEFQRRQRHRTGRRNRRTGTSRTGSKEQRIVERFMIFDPLLPIVSQQFQRNAGYLQLEYTICK